MVNEIASLISFWFFIVSVEEYKRFLCINFIFCNFAESID